MSNPFDQFDQPPANPFDQFDAPQANWQNAAATGFVNGLPIVGPWAKGKMQELTAWGQSKGTGEPYDQALSEIRGAGDASAQAYPKTAFGGNIAGSIAGSAPMMAVAGPLGLVGGGAAIGAADAGARNNWDPAAMAEGGAIGAGSGALGKAVGQGASWLGQKALAALRSYAPVPTLAGTQAAKDAAYAAVDANGTLATPQGGQRLADAIRKTMADFGYDPALQPGGQAVLDRVGQMASPDAGVAGTTLSGVDKLRQVAGNMAQSGKSGAALSSRIKANIDDFVNNPQPGDWIGADQGQGAADLANARRLNSVVAKTQAFDRPMELGEDQAAATGSGGNIRNKQAQAAVRLKYGDQSWTPDEEAALNSVIRPGGLEQALRIYGKGDPTAHGGAGLAELPIMALVGAEGGLHGAAIGAGTIAGSMAARRLSNAIMNSTKNAARDTILNGGINPYAPNAAQVLIGKAGVPLGRVIAGGAIGAGNQINQQ